PPHCIFRAHLIEGGLPIAPFVRIFPFALSVGAQRRSRSSAPFDSAACGRYAQGERTTYGFTQAACGRYAQGERTTYGFTQAACGRYAQGERTTYGFAKRPAAATPRANGQLMASPK